MELSRNVYYLDILMVFSLNTCRKQDELSVAQKLEGRELF